MAVLLAASGALMYAASWQRWAGACPWGDAEGALCTVRQDRLYDFLPPIAPWERVGDAAQLGGASLLVLALAFVLLPCALCLLVDAVFAGRSWTRAGSRPGARSTSTTIG